MALCRYLSNSAMGIASNFKLSRNNLINYQPSASIKFRTLEKKLNLPLRPKKPLAPFLKYCSEIRPQLVQENPTVKQKELFKILGHKWHQVDIETKEKMKKEYNEELQHYTQQIMNYKVNLTDEQKKSIEMERFNFNKASKKLEKKARLKELGKPKKPPTPFLLYMMSKNTTKDKKIALTDWLSSLGKEWKLMSEDEKDQFQKESAKLMDQYRVDMTEWEQKMLKLGHTDVVRRQALFDLKDSNIDEDTTKIIKSNLKKNAKSKTKKSVKEIGLVDFSSEKADDSQISDTKIPDNQDKVKQNEEKSFFGKYINFSKDDGGKSGP